MNDSTGEKQNTGATDASPMQDQVTHDTSVASPNATSSGSKTPLWIGIAVIVIGAILISARGYFAGPSTREIETSFVITFLDASRDHAVIECDHPLRGTKVEQPINIPESCEISINGEPATLADLKIGDEGIGRGVWNRETKSVDPLSLAVTR